MKEATDVISGEGSGGRAGAGPAGGSAGARRPGPREIRRRQRIELGREQLLQTAEELFAKRGYYETSLKDVAEMCEFSVASIYTFFDNKEDLYLAVLMRRGAWQREEMGRLAAEEMSAADRLVAMVRAQIEHRRKYPAWGQLHAQMTKIGGRGTGDVPAVYREFYHEIVGLLAGVIAEGQHEGTLRPGDPHALARLCSALIDSFTLMDPVISDEPEGIDAEDFLNFIRETFTLG
ncbi:DNA-binding transcriptional regulator, AcrR family [Thermomonospora echinospora]|uniref:DNA-binding transcriptional regulator, AcrR family n=1 Tax=Thermomonospora echinospora TaxID=1992 RepID=A0A1H6DHS1_9ACTN|nr:TetR/AcrR family transcriptional regulator [Thermomonospora echinospora]SEG84977.1 DNA-binding transcriptional regulator, AcrR family [Thermomonospora echinospora]